VARVGNSRRSGSDVLIAAAGPGRVDGRDAVAGARPHGDSAPVRRGGARGLRPVSSARDPQVSVHARARGPLLGRKGRQAGWLAAACEKG
jgi:hypothetical protein